MLLVVFKPHGHSLTMRFIGGSRDPARTIIMSVVWLDHSRGQSREHITARLSGTTLTAHNHLTVL